MFNSEDGRGFAIVSGDDAFPELLGYSTSGHLNMNQSLPAALEAYLEGYSRYVADVRKGLVAPPILEGVGSATDTFVYPLCNSKWGQGYPYNIYCPREGAHVCPVGCMATAMAQIMYYYKHPVRPAGGVITYDTENVAIGIITEDFSTDEHIYQWDLMRNTDSMMAGAENEASRNAVAQLSYDCGVATKMQYTSNGSGTYDAEALLAFTKYFGYSPATTDCISRDYFATQEEWNAMVKKELDARRPVLYAGASTKGSGGDAAGHAFVIDGYDQKGMVHVNWGWYGDSDGYFNITTLDMGEYAFSEAQSMIYGIKPAVEGEKPMQCNQLVFLSGTTYKTKYFMLGKEIELTTGAFYNFYASAKQWNLCLALYDKHGRFIQNICEPIAFPELDYLYGTNSGVTIFCVLPKTLDDGTKLADGDYTIRVLINEEGFNLPNGEKDWIFPHCYGGKQENWLPVMIKNGVAYLDEVSTPVDRIEVDGADVVSRQYFDLNGRMVDAPAKGSVVIERQTLSNGKTRSVKRVY
jgi:hypothetical protein